MNQPNITPGMFPSQHADPEAVNRQRQIYRALKAIQASEALDTRFEERQTELRAVAAARQQGWDEGCEEGYAQRHVEDYRWGIVVGTAWALVACALLAVALAMHNAPGCLP